MTWTEAFEVNDRERAGAEEGWEEEEEEDEQELVENDMEVLSIR